jgi:DNA replication protein DnaC
VNFFTNALLCIFTKLQWNGKQNKDDAAKLQPISNNVRLALLQILEDRYAKRPVIITSQLPVAAWHEYIGEPTLADAILDRITSNAHRIELKGESLRKLKH